HGARTWLLRWPRPLPPRDLASPSASQGGGLSAPGHLAERAGQAHGDATVGLMVFGCLFFAPSLVLLVIIGVDAIAGTSQFRLVELVFVAKLLAAVAAAVWVILFHAPAALLARLLKAPSETFS